MFAVGKGGKCYSSSKAHEIYSDWGSGTDCKDGKGSKSSNNVYELDHRKMQKIGTHTKPKTTTTTRKPKTTTTAQKPQKPGKLSIYTPRYAQSDLILLYSTTSYPNITHLMGVTHTHT